MTLARLLDTTCHTTRRSELLHPQSRFRDMQQISRGKFDRLLRATAGFTTSDFEGCGLHDRLLARPAP
jgi:hypothetical protein